MTVTLKNITKEQLDIIKEAVLMRHNEYKRRADVCDQAWHALSQAVQVEEEWETAAAHAKART